VSANTIVLHVQLILPTEQNLAQLLCDEGYAQPVQPVPHLPVADDDVHDDEDDNDMTLAEAASASFGVLTPGSLLVVASETAPRLSAKRLVCNFTGVVRPIISHVINR